MDLQSTPLKGIVRSSEDGLFYLFSVNDGDYYDAIDIAFEEIRE